MKYPKSNSSSSLEEILGELKTMYDERKKYSNDYFRRTGKIDQSLQYSSGIAEGLYHAIKLIEDNLGKDTSRGTD